MRYPKKSTVGLAAAGALAAITISAGTAHAATTTGTLELTSTGFCVDVTNGLQQSGNSLQLYACNQSAAQSWTYDPISKTIKSAGGFCMDVRGGKYADKTSVDIYSCHGGKNQQWEYVPATGAVRSVGDPAYCLDAAGGSVANGAAIILYKCHGMANQKWTGPGLFGQNTPLATSAEVPAWMAPAGPRD
jgi:hypothetical protein